MLKTPSGAIELSWRALQREVGLRAGIVLAAVGYLVWFQQLSSGSEDPSLLILVFVVTSVCLWLGTSSPTAVRRYVVGLQVVLLWAALVLAYLALGCADALLFLSAPALLAALGVNPAAGVGVAASGAAVIALRWPEVDRVAVQALFLLMMVAGLGAPMAGRLRAHLQEAWAFTQHAADLSRELRMRQEEVNKLNKALTTANGLLKRSLRELTLAQQEALEARRLKEQFATTVSHELRTPLNTILGFLEVMQRYPEVYGDVTWTTELRRDISEIQVSARYLSGLVDDILDLARVQALHIPVRREDVDIAQVIAEAADLARRLLAGNKDVELRLELPQGLPQLNVDRMRIQQVILNLLANACRFTERGHIQVEAEFTGEEVVVSVSDTGAGIPAHEIPRIFEEFHRASAASASGLGSAGSGLGLAIAKRFVQMHGGRIWVESQPGEGSTFSFSLPLTAKQVSPLSLPRPQGTSRPAGRPSLVLVGDEHGASFLSRRLEGYELLVAADVREARSLVYDRHPDAVLLDIPLESGEKGFGLAPRILPEPVPVISCSLPGSRRHVGSDLFAEWLMKPINSDRLAEALRNGPRASRVMVVDDDASFVRLIERYLEVGSIGAPEIACARSGEEALALARKFKPDVVLLDMALPGIDGWEVARSLREEELDPQPRLVAVTALDPTQGLAGSARTFSVTKSVGLSEGETVGLIQACLAQLRPAYSCDSPVSEP
ncbi:MAG: response regulator [Anaerolineae bacterium]|nr:response regulator [Anaerolineae bacterium]